MECKACKVRDDVIESLHRRFDEDRDKIHELKRKIGELNRKEKLKCEMIDGLKHAEKISSKVHEDVIESLHRRLDQYERIMSQQSGVIKKFQEQQLTPKQKQKQERNNKKKKK